LHFACAFLCIASALPSSGNFDGYEAAQAHCQLNMCVDELCTQKTDQEVAAAAASSGRRRRQSSYGTRQEVSTHTLRDIFGGSASVWGTSGSFAPDGDRTRREESFRISLVFMTKDGGNVFTPEHMQHAQGVEKALLAACNARNTGLCGPPNSLVPFFYPPDGQYVPIAGSGVCASRDFFAACTCVRLLALLACR